MAMEDHHTATVQPQTSQSTSWQVHEETTDIQNPHATCAKPTTPVDRSQTPQDEPLELRAGKEVGGGWEAGENTHRQNKAASKPQLPFPHLPKPISASLEGEQENRVAIDPADNGELQGIIDDPDDIWHDPRGRVGHLLAHTHGADTQCEDETVPGQMVKSAT
ncbi:hypothetical protein JVT61DRAFT_12152 [Boletus reticuloceps]|uniref:Uncharacterized protein n=1 Tax=Boletus reticuloceps TaxID=495285 RepID=A0A8I2YE95_9AGAM|nr:hypothetical protein JVT61DRAFT_12152 [Boletus reticuloceps]